MNKPFLINRNLVYLGVPAALFLSLIALMSSVDFNTTNSLDLAVTIDLLIVVPLVYFILIRKSDIPKTTIVPVMILGLVLGLTYLPEDHQTYLQLFKNWALPIIELAVISFIIYKVRKGIRAYKSSKNKSLDFYTAVKEACSQILPKKAVLPFATEVAVMYYGFVNWKSRAIEENEFTIHEKSGTQGLLGAFIMAIAIETVAFHFLLDSWNTTVAWVFTILSIYTAVQVFGIAKSLSQRPLVLNENKLILRYGILSETEIHLSDIASIEMNKKELPKEKLTKTLSPFGSLESHNIVLKLNKEQDLIGLYGVKRKCNTVAFHVDEPERFVETVQQYIREPNLI